MHKLDHVVFGAITLEEGTDYVENILKTKLSNIGYHKDMGTQNRVLKIFFRRIGKVQLVQLAQF